MTEFPVVGGKLIRPGFYRRPGAGVDYARKITTTAEQGNCLLCPGHDQTVTHKGEGFTVIQARPAYAHFDAQEVATHELLFPDEHVNSYRALGRRAIRRIEDFIEDYKAATPEDLRFQRYTRDEGNPSKSIEHLHTHLFRLSLRPIVRLSFDAHGGGVTRLDFGELTPEQILAINASRTGESPRR